MLMNQDLVSHCRLLMGRVKYYKPYVIAIGQQNNTKAFAHLPPSSKTRLSTQDHLESSDSVSLLHINIDDFSSAKLYQQSISRLVVVMISREM